MTEVPPAARRTQVPVAWEASAVVPAAWAVPAVPVAVLVGSAEAPAAWAAPVVPVAWAAPVARAAWVAPAAWGARAAWAAPVGPAVSVAWVARAGAGGMGGAGGGGPILATITLVPDALVLIVGGTDHIHAMGTYSDETQEDLTADVDWQVANQAIAALGPQDADGRTVVGLGEGRTTLTASLDGVVSLPASVRVEAVRPERITIEPPDVRVAVGATVDLRAFADFNDGNRADVTVLADWRSANGLVAEVSSQDGSRGRLTGRLPGRTTVTASFEGLVSVPVAVEVSDAVLVSLEITPDDPTAPLGERVAFTAAGLYGDGSRRDLTAQVTWASSRPALARFLADPVGTVETLAAGATDITATLGAVVSPASTLTVTDARVVSLAVRLDAVDLVVGTGTRAHATATLSDQSMVDFTAQVQWQSSAPAVASVDAAGRITGLGVGQADIRAVSGQITSPPAGLRVTAVALTGLVVDPIDVSVGVGEVVRLRARGTFNDGSQADVTEQARWQSANPVVARVDDAAGSKGTVTGAAAGRTRVTASLAAFAAGADVAVRAAVLERIELTPDLLDLAAGRSAQITATAFFDDGSQRDVTGEATWASDAPAVATVVSEGVGRGRVTGVAAGNAFITATLSGVDSAPAAVTVARAELASIALQPSDVGVVIGQTTQLRALGTYTDDSIQDLTEQVQWVSLDAAVASVSNAPGTRGRVSGLRIGQTTVRASLAAVLSDSAAVAVLPVPNLAPEVRLLCPELGREGEALTFSGVGSSDPDGAIARFIWSFGDGSPPVDAGLAPELAYTYRRSGPFLVELTVEDDAGARATARCNIVISSADAPRVRLVRPQGVRITTQGELISTLVDARPGPGRDIVSTAILVDGVEVATDETAPYEMDYTVPLNAATGGTLRLTARAIDTRGDVGLSEATLLQVENELPVPAFVAIPTDVRRVHVDASGVRDDTTDTADLQVRWDFEDDGVWDTAFSVEKTADFVYPDNGNYTVRMQVRDNIGQLASTTRDVRFVDQLVVFGDLESQVWFGTVRVTGDVRVLPGNTLTIAAGTQVLFVYQDQNNNQIGDMTLTVSGRLLVQGDPDNPVVFTPAVPGAANNRWDRILLAGDQPSLIENAVIENANVGIESRDGSDLTGVTIRNMSEQCLLLNGGTGFVLSGLELSACTIGLHARTARAITLDASLVHDTTDRGIVTESNAELTVTNSTVRTAAHQGVTANVGLLTVNDSLIERNGGSGLEHTEGTLNMRGSTVTRNGARGLWLRGRLGGVVTQNHLTENAHEGVAIQALAGQNPTIVVTRNNLHSNAAGGAWRITHPAVNTSAVDASSDNNPVVSAAYRPGQRILNAEVTCTLAAGAQGYCELRPTGGATVRVNGQANVDLSGADIRELRVAAERDCCANVTATLTRVTLEALAGPVQAVVDHDGAATNLRSNYLGVYPEVLPAVALSRPQAADIQGFVGVPFVNGWETGPYVAGNLGPDITWHDTVYISGDVTAPANGRVIIEAGTRILVAPIDQDGDGLGDYEFRTNGVLEIRGTAAQPVIIAADAAPGAPRDWHRILVTGANSIIDHVVVEDADIGLELTGANGQLHDSILRNNRIGLRTATAAQTIERTRIQDNAEIGALLEVGSTLTDVLVSGNGTQGIEVTAGGVVVDHAEITDNIGQGVFIRPTGGARFVASRVTFNRGAGFVAQTLAAVHPQLAVEGSNIFGNAAAGAGMGGAWVGVEQAVNVSAVDASSDNNPVVSAAFAAAHPIVEALATTVLAAGAQGYGEVRGTRTTRVNGANVWAPLDLDRSFRVAAERDCCANVTITATRLRMLQQDVQGVELSAAVYAANRVTLTNDFWGAEPIFGQQIREVQVGSIQLVGFQPNQIAGTGPRQLP